MTKPELRIRINVNKDNLRSVYMHNSILQEKEYHTL